MLPYRIARPEIVKSPTDPGTLGAFWLRTNEELPYFSSTLLMDLVWTVIAKQALIRRKTHIKRRDLNLGKAKFLS